MKNWLMAMIISLAFFIGSEHPAAINHPSDEHNRNDSIAKILQDEEEHYITTPSGLKYLDLVEGIGRTPEKGQRLVVHYIGWLENGKQFDNSYEHDKPFEFIFGMGQVIKGWDEGLATMKANGKRRLIVPPQLAYGEKGSKNSIPPNATLIFEVELLSIRYERPGR